MRVEIFYCPVWNGYDQRAASVAAELHEAGHDARVVEGEKSQFDVIADGELFFSKQAVGRFPEPGEVLELVTAHTG